MSDGFILLGILWILGMLGCILIVVNMVADELTKIRKILESRNGN
jgi:hypothetical protein